MRILALAAALAPVAAFAGHGLLGTRADVAPTAAGSPVGVMPMVQMMVALAVVIAIVKYVLPKVLNRVTKPTKDGDIVVESTAALGTGNLHIVKTRGRTLLVGATANGMSCLADLTEEPSAPELPKQTFEEMLAAATMTAPEPVAARPVDNVTLALERLRALED